MKINRLIRVIAVLLALTMLPLWMFGCGRASNTVRERLVEMMVGDGKLSDKNKETEEYLEKLNSDTELIMANASKGGGWQAVYLEPGSTYIARCYENCYKLAVAWSTKGCEYYHDRKVMTHIKNTLEKVYLDGYGEEEKLDTDRELSSTESYDQAEYLLRTLLILKDNGKLSNKKIENYASVPAAKIPAPVGSGVVLARSSYIVLAYSALLKGENYLKTVATKYAVGMLSDVTSSSGLYADGSFISDIEIASSGSYGVVAFSNMVEIAYAVMDEEDIDFPAEAGVWDYLYKWATTSIIPSLYNGRAFASTVSSYLVDAEKLGGRAVSALLALADCLEEKDATKALELRQIVKGYGNETVSNFNRYLTTYGMTEYEDIVKDKEIQAKTVLGAHSFAAMDKLTVIGGKYSASLSISSARTAKYETRKDHFAEKDADENDLTAVNGRGWYTGDGMLMLYTSSYAPDSNYWKYVNGLRIPGTTVDSRPRKDINAGGYDGTLFASGSVTLGSYAVASYDFINNNSELRSDLAAKKSYFFFDGEIVALGAGITNTYVDDKADEQYIETVVENISYGTFTSVSTSPYQDDDKTLAQNKTELAPSALYVLKYGGIYVPADKNDTLKYSLNVTDGGNFVELWIDHNNVTVDPITGEEISSPVISGKTYEYCIVPSTVMNMNEFFAYVAAPGYTVLANDEKVQAVKDASSGATGYTFWEAGSCNGIATDFACSVMVHETDSQITISVADISHTASAVPGNITLSAGGTVVSASAGISLNGTTLTVDRTVAASGQTLTIVINK